MSAPNHQHEEMLKDLLAQQEEWYAEERRIFEELDDELKGVLDVLAKYPVLWQSGDGYGGYVLRRLVEGAAARGLDIQYTQHEPTHMVEMLSERDGWNCRYCGVLLAGASGIPWPEADHVIPKSKGGKDSIDNRVLACPSCNSTKGAKSVEEFLAYQERKAAE